MAQTGYTPIQLYRTATASAAPTSGNLADGELAINTLDGKLFYKDSSGNVQTIATKGTGPIGGSTTQVQFNSSGALGGSASLTWDGTTLTSANSITSPVYKSATTLSLQTNGTTNAVYIDASQNVGIGTSSPTAKLDVLTSINLGQNYLNVGFDAGGGSGWLGGYNATYSSSAVKTVTTGALSAIFYGGNGVQFFTNSSAVAGTTATERMRIDTSGNVGIGITPNAWSGYTALQMAGPSMWGASGLGHWSVNAYYDGTSYKYISTDAATDYYQYAGTHVWRYAASGTAGATVSLLEAMRIDASGNLLVGTTTVLNNSKVTIVHPNPQIVTRHGSATAGKYWNSPYINSSNLCYIINQDNTGVYLTDGATAWSANSDERLKDIIAPIASALEGVQSLRAVKYSWKSDEAKVPHIGLIAQDVQKVLPEVVTSAKLPMSEDETEYLGVSYTEVIPLLVAAIQELSAKVTALESR